MQGAKNPLQVKAAEKRSSHTETIDGNVKGFPICC